MQDLTDNEQERQEHRHSVQFYWDDECLLGSLSEEIGSALNAGGAAIVIAIPPHTDDLNERLRGRGVDAASAINEGRYLVRDAAETLASFMVDGWPNKDRFQEVIGGAVMRTALIARPESPRLFAFGEMVTLLWSQGMSQAALRLEEMWNELIQRYGFTLHCAYPMNAFRGPDDAESFRRVCEAHSSVTPADRAEQFSENNYRRVLAIMQQTTEALESEKALSRNLFRLQDEEQRHVGRELHDTIGQYLSALKMELDSLQFEPGLQDKGARRQLGTSIELVDQCIKEVRTMSYLLYPPLIEEMGLKVAVPWYIDGFGKRSGIKTRLEMSRDFVRLPRNVELVLFRVLQECLTNVHRHSGSLTALIRVFVENEIAVMEISDAGKGLPTGILEFGQKGTYSPGIGLRSMSERVRGIGGKLELSSAGNGTTVRASVPCSTSTPEAKTIQ